MLPVASEVLSARAHSGPKPGPQSDSKDPTQFADMLDDAPAKADQPAVNGQPAVAEPAKAPVTVAKASDQVPQGIQPAVATNLPLPSDAAADPAVALINAAAADIAPAAQTDETAAPAPTDNSQDDAEDDADALLAVIAQLTGTPAAPVTSPKKDAKPTDPADNDANRDKEPKADAATTTVTPEATVVTPIAAAVVTPVAQAQPTETKPAEPTQAATVQPMTVGLVVPDVDPQLAKTVATAVDKDGKAVKDDKTGKPALDAATPLSIAKTDTAPAPAAANTQTLDRAPQPQAGQPAAQAANQPAAAVSDHSGKAGEAHQASPRPDLPAPDAAPAKTIDALQPLMPLQANATTTPAANQAAPAPATSPNTPPAVALPVAGIAVEIAGKALAGKNRFEIRLDPPELGRIHVRLDIDHDGQVTSHITADRSDTFDLLRRDASGLERALQDAGMKTANNGLQFSLRDQGFSRQQQPAQLPNSAQVIVRDDSLDAAAIAPAYRAITGLRGGVDIRV